MDAQLSFRSLELPLIMNSMQRTGLQFSLLSMIGLVACVAINLWLFQWHVFAGIVGLNVTKHVLIAYLCQVMGVNKRHILEESRIQPLRHRLHFPSLRRIHEVSGGDTEPIPLGYAWS